jgi:nucleotide-binding universal stress UspA family protein
VVLVGIDLHKGSTLVMRRALAQAAAMGADLHLLCVAEPNIANVKPPDEMDASDLTGTDMHRLQEFVEHRLADFTKKRPNIKAPKVDTHHDTGDPAEKLVKLAAALDADIVILGTHGRTGIKRFLIGSVAEKVVRNAGCQVLVVREKNHEGKE